MDILIYMGIFAVGSLYGWHLRERYAQRRIDKILKEVHQEVAADLIPIHIEHTDNMFYVYHKDDHSFMAQGETRRTLENNLATRYPGKRFAAHDDNLKEVGFK